MMSEYCDDLPASAVNKVNIGTCKYDVLNTISYTSIEP
jgi:hypothetical protein